MISLILSAMTMAIAAFALYMIFEQTDKSHNYPLMLALLCLGLLPSGAIVFQVVPNMAWLYISLLPIILYALLPGIWLYHKAIISQEIWKPSRSAIKHFVPMLFALVLSASLVLLPINEFNKMFFTEQKVKDTQTLLTIYLFLAASLTWCVLSLVYSIAIFRQTLVYRKNLNNMFANQHGKSVWWIERLSILIVCTLLYSLAILLFENQFETIFVSETGVFVLLLLLVCLLAYKGLRQEPGFAEVNQVPSTLAAEYRQRGDLLSKENVLDDTTKYKRSALSLEQCQRIAQKIDYAINVEKIYFDPTLTLTTFSRHLSVPSQYISQTLSQHMHTTFFDYVNEARIKAAMPMLLEGKKGVLDIAMSVGFNARSSFYKFFKRYTGATPREFRENNNNNVDTK